MDQYIHTFIPIDSEFRPSSGQVESFYRRLVSDFSFGSVSGQRRLPGVVVMKPSGKLRWGTNPMTGEKISIPANDLLNLERVEDIPAAIEGCAHFRVDQSGQWVGEDRPIKLLGIDGVPFEGSYICTVACESRSEPVSTSAWGVEAGPNTRDIPEFDSPCTNAAAEGIFPNPWTGEVIVIAGAGCARFWIEFEFGKFIYPKIESSFDVMSPKIVQGITQCFGTDFVQGCRFW